MIGISPYLELSNVIISTLRFDGMTKMAEILSEAKPIWTQTGPRVKDSQQGLRLGKKEIKIIKGKIEKLTGNKITRKKLKEAIETMQKATKAFRRFQQLRKGNTVMMGRDAMLVNQAALWDDIKRWTEKTEALRDELKARIYPRALVGVVRR